MPSTKSQISITLLLGGGLLLFLSQKIKLDGLLTQGYDPAWHLLLGVLLVALGYLTFQSEKVFLYLDSRIQKISKWLEIKPLQIVLITLSIPFAIMVPLAAGGNGLMNSPFPAIFAWLVSISLIVIGGYSYKTNKFIIKTQTMYWLAILALASLPIRGIATDHIPINLTGDEGSSGIFAARFLTGEWDNIFITGWYSFPNLFYYFQSLSIKIFGQNTEALRYLSGVVGTLTVLALYLIGKKMFNHRVGLIAAMSLIALPLHIHFSRIGLNNIWDGLWYVVVVGTLWTAWRYENRIAYILAGAGLGLAQYFYPSSRALFVLCGASLVLAFFFNRKKLRRSLAHIFIMVFTTLVIFLPLGWYYIKFPDQYLAPLNRVSIFGDWMDVQMQLTGLPMWEIVINQILIGLKAYTYTPLLFWYKPETPILLPLAASFFYIGLILLVVRYRDGRLTLIALWLTAITLAGSLSESTPAAQRFVAAAPVSALLIGIGLSESSSMLSSLIPKASKYFNIITFVIIGIIVTNDLRFYFVDYKQISIIQNTRSNNVIAQTLANELKLKPPGTQVLFFGTNNMGYFSIPSIQYLAPKVTGYDIIDPWESLENKFDYASRPLIFVFLSDRQDEFEAVQNDYPNGTLIIERAWNNEILYSLYEVSDFP
ncbi:MAG: glycosyltransferase family 39 protein [Anaerolineae bacterium]|nr:glycosyltransferase family 39 protein [Anaerolineae bacterium]